VLVRKNVLSEVHLHEVKQLEKKLADAEVLADHLELVLREEVFELGLFM
jgi:hypothetical protein